MKSKKKSIILQTKSKNWQNEINNIQINHDEIKKKKLRRIPKKRKNTRKPDKILINPAGKSKTEEKISAEK